MMNPTGTHNKKSLEGELNLIPFIDLLSVCICFLLITAVWIQVGSLSTKQAVGGQAAEDNQKKPTLWVFMQDAGQVILDARDAKIPTALSKVKVQGIDGKPDYAKISQLVNQIKASEPGLRTALIQPIAATVYEDIVDLMDQFKKAGMIDLGVSPL
jgi:biopolymer transport protein TolR